MLVVIANNLPDAVRGRMKLWFIEPKPNVFVSGIKNSTAENVIKYLYSKCDESCGLIIFNQQSSTPGYFMTMMGTADKKILNISGLQLISEKTT